MQAAEERHLLWIWPERKPDVSVLSSLTSEERLMVVYFGNVIYSVLHYLNERPTWVCISLNSFEPISNRACYKLIHRYIQDAGGFCSSNAKHLTSAHRSYASRFQAKIKWDRGRTRLESEEDTFRCLPEILSDWKISFGK